MVVFKITSFGNNISPFTHFPFLEVSPIDLEYFPLVHQSKFENSIDKLFSLGNEKS